MKSVQTCVANMEMGAITTQLSALLALLLQGSTTFTTLYTITTIAILGGSTSYDE